MASQSILRAGMRSPIHALLKPSTTRSILKKPAPLPLSPKPLQVAASFSIIINSPRPSPHVHFPSSPAIAATFAAYSPNTYDRGPITRSPESPGLSGWADRQLSPSAHNAFKLLAPPVRRLQEQRLLAVPAFEDPRSPKPYKEKEAHRAAATQQLHLLSVPPIEDPRSPKPFKPRAGVCFQELTLHVPRVARGAGELAKALSTYPRSPYPSAPIEEDMDVDVNVDMDVDMDVDSGRGRKSGRPRPQPASRSRSLENKRKLRARSAALAQASPLRQSFMSPKAKPAPAPLDFDLETAFWQSVTLEGEPESAYVTAADMVFGSKDGELVSMTKAPDRVGFLSLLSPKFRKGMVASPSPHDPSAAFPSFTAAMSGVAYPLPARLARGRVRIV